MARYEQIATALRDSILAGRYAPGERLPRQRDLARMWQTTLPTVRQALDQLRQDGLIRVEHGVGTFVADLDRTFDPFAVTSFTEALREHGLDVETRLLSLDLQACSTAATAALEIPEGERLVALTRLRLAGSLPIVLQYSYAPGRLRVDLERYDGSDPLYTFLRHRSGLVAGAYRETVTAETASDSVAEALEIVAGAPILIARRTTTTNQGHPFLYDEAFLPPERIQLAITRQGASCAVDLSPVLAAPTDNR